MSRLATFDGNIRDAEASTVLIYPLMYTIRSRFDDALHPLSVDYLRELARKTGTHVHRASTLQNVQQAFASIAEELRHQYSLSYYPKRAMRDGQRCRIRVDVSQPKLVVRSRDSYIYYLSQPKKR
jgi:hypothetical protein